VEHRGSHLQIIASAGSGKTEVVSQRVASLLADDELRPESIVAFTFTERAAAELKERIAERVEQRQGPAALDHLGGLFVGTIHSYCFRLLQTRVPRYETYDVLDENRLNAFLSREAYQLNLKSLDPKGKDRLFASIEAFLKGLDVIENELLAPEKLPAEFGHIYQKYLGHLERYRLLTYGQQVVRAVAALETPEVAAAVHEELGHLIVDEYQDINPAQERLIELLTDGGAELCVVGDDDQAIYQWRGSDVGNIVNFVKRCRKRGKKVATFELITNRRSRPAIVQTANVVAAKIEDRLPKVMNTHRPKPPSGHAVVAWAGDYEIEEAGHLANAIIELHDEHQVAYSDIAILVRSRSAYPKILDQLNTFAIPVQPGGRTGLFDQPEALVLGKTIVWLTGLDWRTGYGWGEQVGDDELLREYAAVFDVKGARKKQLRSTLEAWRTKATSDRGKSARPADLVGDFYELLDVLAVRRWDLTDQIQLNRLGTLARFSSLLADYEAVRRRARADENNPGEQVGGQDGGEWYYRNLGIHILNYAQGAYEGFDGEPDARIDAVDITTVHRAKGLEWPVVFVPSLTKNRFPNSLAGAEQPWPIPRELFDADRYEGSLNDERRLFYVAMTRARDFASFSRHDHVNKAAVQPSPFWETVAKKAGVSQPDRLPYPEIGSASATDEPLEITYSDLDAFLDCAMAYRLRNRLGFQPRLAPELGYGKAVHHVLRTIADETKERGRVPTKAQLDTLLDRSFFLPAANKAAHRNLKEAARRLVDSYVKNHKADLLRIWETERPFELHLDGVTVTGRADVILDEEGGVPKAMAILDYKTSTDPGNDHGLQLQVYTDAGRREGLDVRGAYVHDLKRGVRTDVDVTDHAVAEAEATVRGAAGRLRAGDFAPSPGKRCRSCEVRTICKSAQR
jgi:DNA helicase-2/ATP-dependent DNA helicase PcrA